MRFEGSAARDCKNLWKSIVRNRKTLIERYPTKDALRTMVAKQRDSLIAEFVEPLLEEFGSVIWCTSRPYVTRLNPQYPRHLMYDNVEDRERSVLDGR
jgi:hypothetical protein